eukprot:291400-Pleurochrysis_carterae.AAC.1
MNLACKISDEIASRVVRLPSPVVTTAGATARDGSGTTRTPTLSKGTMEPSRRVRCAAPLVGATARPT